jgi:hypothetical protein
MPFRQSPWSSQVTPNQFMSCAPVLAIRVQAASCTAVLNVPEASVQDDRDDAWMLEVYAGENFTQRGSNGLAEAGTVAGAVRWLAKAIITGGCNEFVTSSTLPELRGNLACQRGLGQRVIADFLSHVPGLDRNIINQHLANLKASSDYARIITEVADKVLRDPPDVEASKTANQAAAQARERNGTCTFDFQGVTQYLRNSHQIEVFRKVVTGKALRDALPVENQAPLAQHLVELAQSRKNAEVSGTFIREHVMALFLGAKDTSRKIDRETQQRLQEEDVRLKIHQYGRDMARSFRLIAATGLKMERLAKECPEAFTTLDELGELQKALRSAKRFIDLLNERICP